MEYLVSRDHKTTSRAIKKPCKKCGEPIANGDKVVTRKQGSLLYRASRHYDV